MMKRLMSLLLILMLLPATSLAAPIQLLPLQQGALAPISLAPDGQSGLYAAEGELMIVRTDGSVLPVTVSQTRGAADTYGNLERIASMGLRAIGAEGLAWSPDGRYAALVNQNQVAIYAHFYYDPIVLDTHTGELFLAATYENKATKENCGVVITACFSGDSRYLYAIILGRLNGRRFSLVQYDLETLEAVTLYACDKESPHYWPHLNQLRDGSFLLLTDQTKQHLPTGIRRILPQGGEAAVTHADFLQPSAYFYPRSLQYSRDSSYALILASSSVPSADSQSGMQTVYHFTRLMCLRPDEGELAKDEYWEIPSLDAEKVAVLTGNEAQSPSPVYLHSMCLSPDGERALIVCAAEKGQYTLRMLNLTDGSLTPVTGVDSDTLRSMCMADTLYLDWSGDTILLGKQGMVPLAYQIKE